MWVYSIVCFLAVLFLQESYALHNITENRFLQNRSKDGVTVLETDFYRSESDKASYRLVKLSNDLQVMLISDTSQETSVASMSVGVGVGSDPKEIPGLAHFCEHLLFLGTKKYPGEDEFTKYISFYAGDTNAYTGIDETNYHFYVSSNGLDGALDRFAQFFIAPSFPKDFVEREVLAVDSENLQNTENDNWRIQQILRHVSNPNSGYNSPGAGNYQSLIEIPRKKGIDIIKALLEFHKTYYSASIMKLTVLSNHSLDDLQELVAKYFSEIPNNGIKKPVFKESPFGPNQLKKKYFYKPVSDYLSLGVWFPVINISSIYRSRPQDYYLYLLEHKIVGSFRDHLSKLELASSVSASMVHLVSDIQAFAVEIAITQKGYDEHEKVIKLLFEYLQMLREKGVQEWLFKELKEIDEMNFRFEENPVLLDSIAYMSSNMQQTYIKYKDYLSSDIIKDYNKDHLEKFLADMVPEKCLVIIVSPRRNEGWDQIEPWFESEYAVEPFSENYLKSLKNATALSTFRFPEPNPFIPKKFVIQPPKPIPENRPSLIHQTASSRIWFKTDDRYASPKGYLSMTFYCPGFYETPRQPISAMIYVKMLSSELRDMLYYASIVGYTFSLAHDSIGYKLNIYGYTDKIYVLLETFLKTLVNFKLDMALYLGVKDRLTHSYPMRLHAMPYRQLFSNYDILVEESLWSTHDHLYALKTHRYEDMIAFKEKLFQRLFVEGLILGAFSTDQIKAIIQVIEKVVKTPMYSNQIYRSRCYSLDEGTNYIRQVSLLDPKERDSAILYALQLGSATDVKLLAFAEYLSRFSQEEVDSQLRTREQLGYTVHADIYLSSTMLNFRIMVQSLRHPFYLEQRIVAVLYKLAAMIDNLSEKKFNTFKSIVIGAVNQTYSHMALEGDHHWTSMLSGYYFFLYRDEVSKAIQKMTLHDMKEMFYKYVYPNSKERRKLSVHLKSKTLEEVSVYDISLRRLYFYLKCKKMEISRQELTEIRKASHTLLGFQNTLLKTLESKYKKKDINSTLSMAFDFIKVQHKKLRQKAIDKYDIFDITDVMAFKSSLKLTEAPHPLISLEAYKKTFIATDKII